MMHADSALKRYQIACLILASASILTVSLWGGMLYDRVNPNPELSGVLNLLGFPVSALLSVSALAIALWFDRGFWKPGLISIGVSGLVVWSTVSIFGSPHLHASLVTFAILTAAVALGWSISAARFPRPAQMGVAMALVTAASIVGALGISEYLGHIARPPRDFSWRVFSTFAAPNFLAGYLVMTVPIAAACFLAARERLVKLLCGLGLSIQIACLLLTGSRFGLVSLAAAMVTLAILITRRGLFQGVSGRKGRLAGAMILAVALLGSIPIGLRLFRSGAESHSTQFRLYTWRGAAKMAAANPVLGTGIGSFDVAYSPYAEVAYTQHAHNTYLQLAGEGGIPALVLLLLVSGAALRSALSSARLMPEPNPDPISEQSASKRSQKAADLPPTVPTWADSAPALLSAGLAAGLVGALVRNLFDSDLYIPANAFIFALVSAMSLSSRAPLPESTVNRPLLRRVFAVLITILMLLVLAPYTAGRIFARAAEVAIPTGDLSAARASYKRAAMADRENQEYLLKLANLQAAAGDMSAAEQSYEGSVLRARTGKAPYQYARFLSQQKRIPEAIKWHERARAVEPNNLQNLLALAEANSAESRMSDSERIYRRIAALYESPFGQVRAIPELIEYEFGEAHRALGEIELARGEKSSAERNLRKAVDILGEFWDRRKNPMVQLQVRPEKALLGGGQLEKALSSLAGMLQDFGRADEAQAITERRSNVLSEIEQDRTAAPAG